MRKSNVALRWSFLRLKSWADALSILKTSCLGLTVSQVMRTAKPIRTIRASMTTAMIRTSFEAGDGVAGGGGGSELAILEGRSGVFEL